MNNPQKKYWIYINYPALNKTKKVATPFKTMTEAINFAMAYIASYGYHYEIKGE